MLKAADFISHIWATLFSSLIFHFGNSFGILALHFASYPNSSVTNRTEQYIGLLVIIIIVVVIVVVVGVGAVVVVVIIIIFIVIIIIIIITIIIILFK